MNICKWLLFSFSVPTKLQGFRVKIWRKLNALGAVQIKNAVYALPASEHHKEQLAWMAKQTDEQGGEALIIANGELLTIADSAIRAAFTQARDADYLSLEEELRAALDSADIEDAPAVLRRFERRLETVQAIDFFPSGKADVVARLLEEARHRMEEPSPSLTLLDASRYRGKTWVTRANPYVDRLASFWLVRRFVDPQATIRFLAESDAVPTEPDCVLFDMVDAEFTHTGELITFEALVESFGLVSSVPARMRRVLKAIDLEELDAGPVETAGIKRMLDGLIANNSDDFARIDQALQFFDTLLASYALT